MFRGVLLLESGVHKITESGTFLCLETICLCYIKQLCFYSYSVLAGGSNKTGTITIHDTLCPSGSTHQCPIIANAVTPISSSDRTTSYAVRSVQWYPHDTGMFVTSSADRTVKVWDTNEMCPVERFRFTKPLYTHTMGVAESHCLIAGKV